MGPRTLRLELPTLPPAEYSANRARGAAWARQYRVSHGKQGAVDEIISLVKEQGWQGPPMQQATIKIMFHLPDRRRRDGFGLLERMKPWLDGLCQGDPTRRVLLDDDLLVIGFPTADWCWDPGHPQTVIEITEVEDSAAGSVRVCTRGDRAQTTNSRTQPRPSAPKPLSEAASGPSKEIDTLPQKANRLNIPISRIVAALRHEGNKSAAARSLGCSPAYIRKRLKESGQL